MVKKEFYKNREDGVKLFRYYSDKYLLIEDESGTRYSEVIIPEDGVQKIYTETNEFIDIQPDMPVYEVLNAIKNELSTQNQSVESLTGCVLEMSEIVYQ